MPDDPSAPVPVTTPAPLSWELRPDGVAILSYDLLGAERNVLEEGFVDAFDGAFEGLNRHPEVRAAILVSKKNGTWIAGAGPSMLDTLADARAAEAMSLAGHRMLRRLESSTKPVVAAISGAAFGGGFEIALACHGRVLADNRSTVLSLPEVELGLLPGMSGMQRLAALAGLDAALEYGLTGKGMRPSVARALGIADDVVAPPLLIDASAALARSLADAPRRRPSGPSKGSWAEPLARARAAVFQRTRDHLPAPLRVLDVLETYADEGLEASQRLEARSFGELAASPAARQLIGVFLSTLDSKADPGVDTPGVKGRRVGRVELIGEDTWALAQSCTRAGIEVETSAKPGEIDVAFVLGSAGDSTLAWLRKLSGAPSGPVVAYGLASGTLADVTSELQSRANIVGIRHAGPGPRFPLLEVVRSDTTSDEAVATVVSVGKRLGKTVIVLRDHAEGYTRRLRAVLGDEVRRLVAEGHPLSILDDALLEWGWAERPSHLLSIDANDKGPPIRPQHAEDLARRCVLRVVNEAIHCVDKGLLRGLRDGDLGAIEGVGFPRFRGGPFRYVDTVGTAGILASLTDYRGRLGEHWAPAPSLVEAARFDRGLYSNEGLRT